ncbi:hypothetical protein GCM10011351_00570 [Paraliobacillus quinghaiensis]|uniref:Uncharacterized protein n=1 Tax=Paraliobacillus quinghaiensis TaxID=470815 RepID=A0A917TCM1_9BACI|nr:hypothetical protein [Paraliobacillus quinghaiensis]GGM18670.1 hypothetical protein GCM10011351_00570 [Paraliobacillus quinghaiensis]
MTLAYILYFVSLGAAFFVSYIYVTYSMKTTNISLITNLFVASMMHVAIYSFAIFVWFLQALQLNEVQFSSGLELAFWLFVVSEIALLTTMIYKYRKEEVITGTRTILQFIKRNSTKAYNGIKNIPKT